MVDASACSTHVAFPADQVFHATDKYGLAPPSDANFFTVLPQANVEAVATFRARRVGSGCKAPRISVLTMPLINAARHMCDSAMDE